MAVIERTTRIKSTCIICNCMPVDETKETRPPLPMFHAQGVHVNWNEDCNICENCARVMGEMLGLIDPQELADTKLRLATLRDQHESLQEQYVEQSERIKRILEGKKAEKAQRSKAA
jgi:hypothetical protein